MKRIVLLTSLLCSSISVQAGIAVVVHPNNANASLSQEDVEKLFLGKSKSFPNGNAASVVDQTTASASRTGFYEKVIKKNSTQLKAYWTKIVFTGKGTPPKEIGDDAAIKSHVAASPDAIGYIDSSAVDGSVKVVFKAD